MINEIMSKKTALYDQHVAFGAKMVDFGGWQMPLHYGSQVSEHHLVRTEAGMFDVSHMTIVDLEGDAAKPFLQKLLANDVAKLKTPGKALYSCMLNEAGGVIDDLIAYYMSPSWYRVVVNASTRDKDLAWMAAQAKPFALPIQERPALAMIAVQGPKAIAIVQSLLGDALSLAQVKRFSAVMFQDWMVARTGYTGEDGVEIMLPETQASSLWQRLADAGVKPAGLGARDTLRLEAGMNLYGNDMDEAISPLEAGLAWTIMLDADRDFIGKPALLAKQQQDHPIFVGLVLLDKGVLRGHQQVFTPQGEGMITSGTFSPTLGKSIAFARVPKGSEGICEVDIRGKRYQAQIVKPVFVRDGKSCL